MFQDWLVVNAGNTISSHGKHHMKWLASWLLYSNCDLQSGTPDDGVLSYSNAVGNNSVFPFLCFGISTNSVALAAVDAIVKVLLHSMIKNHQLQ